MQNLLLFYCESGCRNAPQCYVIRCLSCWPVNSMKPAALNCQWSLFYHIHMPLLVHVSTKVVVAVISCDLCVSVALAPDSYVKNSTWKISPFGNPCFERDCSPAVSFSTVCNFSSPEVNGMITINQMVRTFPVLFIGQMSMGRRVGVVLWTCRRNYSWIVVTLTLVYSLWEYLCS
jgi:hypothetical protein